MNVRSAGKKKQPLWSQLKYTHYHGEQHCKFSESNKQTNKQSLPPSAR